MTTHFTHQQLQHGVRAEPKFLRDPTALESITSVFSGLSSYVAANIPKKAPTLSFLSSSAPTPENITPYHLQQHGQPQLQNYNTFVGTFPGDAAGLANGNLIKAAAAPVAGEKEELRNDTVIFAAFEWIEVKRGTGANGAVQRRSCLFLGYPDGFQIWDVTNPDNVHEVFSIRDEERIGQVACLQVVPTPRRISGRADEWEEQRPLLAIISTPRPSSPAPSSPVTPSDLLSDPHLTSPAPTPTLKSTVQLYSLRTHAIVKVLEGFEGEDVEVVSIKCNERVLIVAATHPTHAALHTFSALTLNPLGPPLTDVYHDPAVPNAIPGFALGPRFLAYATSTPVAVLEQASGSVGVISGAGLGVLSGEKDVKDAAKEVALEVVNGVRTLGNYSYQTLTSYFSGSANTAATAPGMVGAHVLPPPHAASPPSYAPSQSSPRRAVSLSSSPASLYGRSGYDGFGSSANGGIVNGPVGVAAGTQGRKSVPCGMVMIRDIIHAPHTTMRDSFPPVVAHFRPHTHSISLLSFNPAGTLLTTISTQGHTFHVFSVGGPNLGANDVSAAHLYKLSRGYTDAQVVDCRFSTDSQWCAVSTARGTTHIYAVNPDGGMPEIRGHVRGRVRNSAGNLRREEQTVTQSALLRIRQRTPMPTDTSVPATATLNNTDIVMPILQPQPQSLMSSPLIGSPSSQTMPYMFHAGGTYTHSSSPSPLLTDQITVSKQLRAKLVTAFLEPKRNPYRFYTGHGRTLVSTAATSNGSTGSPKLVPKKSSLPTAAVGVAAVPGPFPKRRSTAFNSLLSTANGVHLRAKSWAFSGSDKGANDRMFGFDEETGDEQAADEAANRRNSEQPVEETGYQDVFSFHPSGILTLHRCWVSVATRKREGSRVVETRELNVGEEDVAEWRLVRGVDWKEVKIVMEAPKKDLDLVSKAPHPSTKLRRSVSTSSCTSLASNNGTPHTSAAGANGGGPWLANAELATYYAHDAPLWLLPQFNFQTYVPKDYDLAVREGRVPNTLRVVIRREVPEPYGSKEGRKGKSVDEDAELEDDISTAMQTQLDGGGGGSNNSFTPGRSPVGGKRLSSSAGATTGGLTMTKPMMNRVPSLSFEDAFLVNMGGGLTMTGTNISGYSPPTSLYPTSIYPTMKHKSNEDLIRFEEGDTGMSYDDDVAVAELGVEMANAHMTFGNGTDVFSPDGDNEVEFPSDSVLVGREEVV